VKLGLRAENSRGGARCLGAGDSSLEHDRIGAALGDRERGCASHDAPTDDRNPHSAWA
jgi:hypothetical protein